MQPIQLRVTSTPHLAIALISGKATLIRALDALATDVGWRDLSLDVAQDHWTNVNVSAALIKAGRGLGANPEPVRIQIESRLSELEDYGGFLAQGNKYVANTNLTSDTGIFMLRHGFLDGAQYIAKHIVAHQLRPGGWSVALTDSVPRIRATSQVLRFLFELRQEANTAIYDSSIRRAIRWLLGSRSPGLHLWSNVARDPFPNLSATIWAFNSLVLAVEADLLSNEAKDTLDRVAIALLDLGDERAWIGTREDVAVKPNDDDKPAERTGSGALSLTIFAPTFWRYASLRRMPEEIERRGIDLVPHFLRRLKLSDPQGPPEHILASEEGAATFTYNLGFALEAIVDIESTLGLQLLSGSATPWTEHDGEFKGPIHTKSWKVRHQLIPWLGWWFTFAIVISWLVRTSKLVPVWYAQWSPFTQGLFMALIGVLIGGIGRSCVLVWRQFRRPRDEL
jgi:hypothetical protein